LLLHAPASTYITHNDKSQVIKNHLGQKTKRKGKRDKKAKLEQNRFSARKQPNGKLNYLDINRSGILIESWKEIR